MPSKKTTNTVNKNKKTTTNAVNKNKNKTQKKKYSIHNTKKMRANKKSHLVHIFLELLNMVKLYHWNTRSYAEHVATDELYKKINENVDRFVEILLGKDETRLRDLDKRLDLINPKNTTELKNRVYEYREFFVNLNNFFNNKYDTDILTVRDDILSDLNQFLYLLTLSK